MVALIIALMLMAGCSATDPHYETRSFFQPQQSVDHHGRKTWLDHLVEVDPGRISVKLAADYGHNPPEHIAVLPFVDQSNAQFRVNKISFTRRNEQFISGLLEFYDSNHPAISTGYILDALKKQ